MSSWVFQKSNLAFFIPFFSPSSFRKWGYGRSSGRPLHPKTGARRHQEDQPREMPDQHGRVAGEWVDKYGPLFLSRCVLAGQIPASPPPPPPPPPPPHLPQALPGLSCFSLIHLVGVPREGRREIRMINLRTVVHMSASWEGKCVIKQAAGPIPNGLF